MLSSEVQASGLHWLRSVRTMSEPKGYNGAIAHIDLTNSRVEIEHPSESFYRTYLGGGALGAYYLLREMPPGADPLGADNVLVFAPSVLTGAPISGLSRFNVTAKSPLTNAIGDAQCGGTWGPQLKFAGFDALLVKGRAPQPVYLWVSQGRIEMRGAAHLVEMFPKEVEEAIRLELGEPRASIIQNGPAGRRLVRFANIGNGLGHFAGRTGMGAVMGAKNLIAVAAHGRRSYAFFDAEKVKACARRATDNYKAMPSQVAFTKLGTARVVAVAQAIGTLPTRNFSSGSLEGAAGLSAEAMEATILRGNASCFGCVVRCKRVVGSDEGPYKLDSAYGGPEYETIALLGSNNGINDIRHVAKANELCNAYGLDTIQTGGLIAFAIECYESGLIGRDVTGGLDLRFGDPDLIIELVQLIGERRGLGDLLAEGFAAAVEAFGPKTADLAVHVKGVALPAYFPQVKKGLGLAFAVTPFGADHMSSEHDGQLEACGPACNAFGLNEPRPLGTLDAEKVRFVLRTQYYYSMLDTLELCDFCFYPGGMTSLRDLEDILTAVVGFPGNLWFLMDAGARRLAMQRAFNYREGIGPASDALPARATVPMSQGVYEGARIDDEEFGRALIDYYGAAGWDPISGRPLRGKLIELGLGWLEDQLKAAGL